MARERGNHRQVDPGRRGVPRPGIQLLGEYAMGMVDGQTVGCPRWWNDVIGYKPLVR